jgi:small subunit ribosomal protein S1
MATDDDDFGAMLAQFEKETGVTPNKKQRAIKVGDLVRARVIKVGAESAFVDLGGKSEGIVPLAELRDAEGKINLAVGDELEGRVLEVGGASGILLRVAGMGRGPGAKAELEQAVQLDLPVEGLVTGVNKGGVEVQVAGVRGFCPISQLDSRHVADANGYVGQKLTFKITKYDASGKFTDLVLSRRALLQEEQSRKAEQLREKLVPGAVLKGTVTSLKDYGAFVDLGGVEGMIHVSELGFSRVSKPSDVLQPGQPVEVVILKITPAEGKQGERIALSLKALEKDPWQDAVEKFPVGTRTSARVVRLETFGAFMELAPGIEGLLHVSELSTGQPLRHAKEKAKVGDVIPVVVNVIDGERRRLSLGLASKADADTVDAEGAARASGPASLGTLADLLAKSMAKQQKKK